MTLPRAGRTLPARCRAPLPLPPRHPRGAARVRLAERTVKEELRANLLARLGDGRADLPRHRRLRRDGPPGGRERDPRRPGHRLPRRARPGQDPPGPAARRPARRVAPGRRRRRAQRRPARARSRAAARAVVAEHGDETPIDWLPRDRRYAEKLATPGHHDRRPDRRGGPDPGRRGPLPGRRARPSTTGSIPRANRGIFAINELPDLAERIQVGLLNILEERDVQVRGFTLRLPLDLFVVASANPEDYTSRGRIITPLKDRLGSQIRTHYPRTLDHEIEIMRQEKLRFAERRRAGRRRARVHAGAGRGADAPRPPLARRSASGPGSASGSASPTWRCSRRRRSSAPSGWARPSPRRAITDLGAVMASTAGKVELETVGDDDARGADRRAAGDEGAVRDVRPARRRSTTWTRSSTRSRRASSSRPANACRRASTCAGCARCPA